MNKNTNTLTSAFSSDNTSTDSKFKLFNFSLLNVNDRPTFIEKSAPVNNEDGTKKIVFAGNDNLYFNYLLNLKDQSVTLSAVLDSIIDQVTGAGLRIKGKDVSDPKLEAYLNSVNRNGEAFNDIHSKTVQDFVKLGNCSLSTVWNKGKSNFELYHLDTSTVRSGEVEEATGLINYYYVSSNWEKGRSAKVKEYPAFNIEDRTGTQIFYYHPYDTGKLYYSLPFWSNVIAWAKIEHLIANFHESNTAAAFMPSLFISYHNGIPSPERADELYEELLEQFSNKSGGAGRAIINFSNDKETAPEITILNNNDNDEKYTSLAELVRSQIIAGIRANSKLCGIEVPGKLGNDNVKENQELFFNIVIKPIQLQLERQYNKLLKANGFTNEIEIIPVQPVSFSVPDSLIDAVYTIDELRIKAGEEVLPDNRGALTKLELQQKSAPVNNILPAAAPSPLTPPSNE